ncbi:MAG: ABC transporter ATP-binding protein/permease [Lachnospiraceae bacterium]|nr:ABC transporter ATP-binding protein/permease [Lachnospiraceae bacterium]
MDNNSKATIGRVLKLIRPYSFMVFLSLLLAVVTVGLTLYAPIITGKAIDMFGGQDQVAFSKLYKLLLTFLIVVAVTGISQWLMAVVNNHITYGVVKKLRVNLFNHLQNMPLMYTDSNPVGAIVNRCISDVDQLSDGILMGFTQLFTGVVTIAATVVIMVILKWQIAIVVVLITPVSLFVAKYIAKKTYDMFILQSDTRGEMTSLIDEMVSNQKIVEAFNHQDEVKDQFSNINIRLKRCSQEAVFYSSLTNPCTRFVNSLVYVGVGLVGGLFAMGGSLSVGTLTVFLSYANQYTKPFNEISGVITELQNAIACAARVFELLDEKEQEDDSRQMDLTSAVKGDVDFKHVYFSYIPELPLMEDVNLKVYPGQRVAIVGPTGCGKTTLINLLMRFYDINRGSISLDGNNINVLKRDAVRHNYGMVLQETWLKHASIRDNIAYGKPDASLEEIMEAAQAVHADNFIRRLPDGYETILGEDGGTLSQGQKQLICIARVMLKLPPMLILDEATSSIDTRTEIHIQHAFARLMKGRTSFVVAHRLSTIKDSDLILVMDDGMIVEQGTHEQLLAADGFYAELYNSQFAVS